jgi:hypothetical protein
MPEFVSMNQSALSRSGLELLATGHLSGKRRNGNNVWLLFARPRECEWATGQKKILLSPRHPVGGKLQTGDERDAPHLG